MRGPDGSLGVRIERDAERVRREYSRRASDQKLRAYYTRLAPSLARQQEHRRFRVAALLDALGPRSGIRVLDVGCGIGADLGDLRDRGFTAHNLVGLDLQAADLANARDRFPEIGFVQGNAAALPFPDGSFDAVMFITVLSSIVDSDVRSVAAREAARVTRHGGLVLSDDFRRADPANPHVVAVDEAELTRLFGGLGSTSMEHHGLSLRIAGRVPAWLARLLSKRPRLLDFILAATSIERKEPRMPDHAL